MVCFLMYLVLVIQLLEVSCVTGSLVSMPIA